MSLKTSKLAHHEVQQRRALKRLFDRIFKSASTAALTTITHVSPATPDYAIQGITSTTPFGFANADEGNTVLSVIRNLQLRVADLETRLAKL